MELLRFNYILVPTLLAWLTCQLSKPLFHWAIGGEFSLMKIFDPGGMPSSHTAMVIGLTTLLGFTEGLDSGLFAVSVVLSLIVIYDATGIRRSAGTHAELINRIIKEMISGELVQPETFQRELKEVLGHNWVEVLAGGLLGGVLAIAYYLLIF